MTTRTELQIKKSTGSPPLRVRAAVLHEPGAPFRIETLDLQPPRAGEVQVRIAAAGVCHSDWHLVTGATKHPLPVVAGHEGAGTVEAVGEGVLRVRPGDFVCLNWAPSCGRCFYCHLGRPGLCTEYVAPIWGGTMMDGTARLSLGGRPVYHFSGLACFAERAVVPEVSCVALPREVPRAVAALIGCAVTTGVGAVLNTARVQPAESVAVYGAGGVGLSIVLGAKLAGAGPIIAVDRSEARAALAGSFGATEGITAGPRAVERIRALTSGRGADHVFDATGVPAVQEECLAAARPGGAVVLVGIAPMGSGTNLSGAAITREEKRVLGSYYGSSVPARDFPLYADLYLKGRLDLGRLVSRAYRLEELNDAYQDMLAGEGARGVILMEEAGAC